LETHAIKILDEPGQILVPQVWDNVSILVPTKEVDELAVKLWQSSVEVMESF